MLFVMEMVLAPPLGRCRMTGSEGFTGSIGFSGSEGLTDTAGSADFTKVGPAAVGPVVGTDCCCGCGLEAAGIDDVLIGGLTPPN